MARVLTHPVVAAGVFTVTIAVWHLAPYYDLMMRNHDVHIATHLMFMVTATLLWWPVMSPVPELPRLGYGLGMLYLFLVGIPMQLVAAMITLTDSVLYPWYARGAADVESLAARGSAARRPAHVGAGQSVDVSGDRGAVLRVG